MKSITTIIFDLDGTLIDSAPDIADAMNRVLARHNEPGRPPESYRTVIGNGMRAMVNQLVPHLDDQRQRSLYGEFAECYSQHLFARSACYPGIAELITALRANGYQLAIFSNKQHELTVRLTTHFFQPGDFVVVKGLKEGEGRKPDPASTRHLLRELNTEPENALMIGDTPIDVETAKAVNMPCLGVSWGYRPAQTLLDSGAAAVVHSAEDIREWLRQNAEPLLSRPNASTAGTVP